MFKLFEIKDGKFKVLPVLDGKKFKGLIISSILLFLVASISGWLKIDEKELLKIYSAIVQHFNLQYVIPKEHTEKALDSKIEMEVDKSIDNVTPEYDRIIEEEAKPENQTGDAGLLGPPMRLCAPWVDNCPKE